MMGAPFPNIGYYNLLDATGTVTVSSEQSGWEKENALNHRPYRQWKPTATASDEWIKIDLGAGNERKADFGAFLGHQMFANGLKARVDWSDDNIAWTNVKSWTPGDDLLQWKTFALTAVHRYWRFRILGDAGAPGPSAFGVIFIGEMFELPECIQPGYDPGRRTVVADSHLSEGGNILGVSVKFVSRRRNWSFDSPGLDITNFFDIATAPGYQDFNNHIEAGSPYFLDWKGDGSDVWYLMAPINAEVGTPQVLPTRRLWTGLAGQAFQD